MRKIGINIGSRSTADLDHYLHTLKQLGFELVFKVSQKIKDPAFLADRVAAHGLAFDTLHGPFSHINDIWYSDDQGMLRELCGGVDTCVAVGAPTMVVHLSSGDQAPPPTDMGRGRFAELVSYAAGKGVKIAFENQRKLGNLAWAFEEFSAEDGVGFCWDCGHEGCFTPGRRYMPLFGDRLICTHIHDNEGIYDKDSHLIPFDGGLDFDYVASALRGADPTVPLVLELKRKATPYEDMSDEDYLARAAAAVKRLRDMIEGE
jgi:sugar phosphate isomerase/epimerase